MDLDLFRFSHGIKPASADALPRQYIDCVGALHPRDGGWPLPTAGGRRHTDLPQRAPSDQTCLLQSGQKTKTSKLKCGRQHNFQGRPSLACLRPLDANERLQRRRRCADGFPGGPSLRYSDYLISALAPASSSFFFAASASALLMPSLTAFGAPSTRSFASFRPRPVSSRTALITLTLFSPMLASITVNSVCSSAAGAAAPAAAGAATETAAAAETPNFSSIALMSSESSRTVIDAILSRISACATAMINS